MKNPAALAPVSATPDEEEEDRPVPSPEVLRTIVAVPMLALVARLGAPRRLPAREEEAPPERRPFVRRRLPDVLRESVRSPDGPRCELPSPPTLVVAVLRAPMPAPEEGVAVDVVKRRASGLASAKEESPVPGPGEAVAKLAMCERTREGGELGVEGAEEPEPCRLCVSA